VRKKNRAKQTPGAEPKRNQSSSDSQEINVKLQTPE
jgi:hypothetical protein